MSITCLFLRLADFSIQRQRACIGTESEGTKERQCVLFDAASAELVVPTAINHLFKLDISELYLGPSSIFDNSCNDEISGIVVIFLSKNTC